MQSTFLRLTHDQLITRDLRLKLDDVIIIELIKQKYIENVNEGFVLLFYFYYNIK